MAVTKQEVTELYVATFNRAPDAGGLNFWVNTSGLTIEQIAKEFFKAPETQRKYPEGTTDAEFVNTIYQNVFGRDAEQTGLDYWVNVLSNGWNSRDGMILTVIGGAQNEDADVLANKTDVGLYFADELGLGGDGPFSLEDVTNDPATADNAKASIDALVSGPPVYEPEPEQRYIEETTVNDTSGYDTSYSNIIDDLLTLPDAQAGMLEPNQVQQAYLHIDPGEDFEFDHDTFVLKGIEAGAKYRIKITPDDPSNFQSNKISWLYDPSGEREDLIMNFTDGFYDGVLYSDTFTAQEDGDHFLSVSMRWNADYGEYADGPEPYDIELIGIPSASVYEIILPG